MRVEWCSLPSCVEPVDGGYKLCAFHRQTLGASRITESCGQSIRYEPPSVGKYEAIGTQIGKLTDEKNAAYGNSFTESGKILAILYPDGVKPEQYGDLLAVARIIDKLFRIATDKDAMGESPWRDIAGYGILGAAK